MNYYIYRPDVEHFAGIGISCGESAINIYYTDEILTVSWKPIKCYGYTDGSRVEGDFPSMSDFWSLPVMSIRAWEALRPLIGYCCEALPILYSANKSYFIIHVTETIDALSEQHSVVKRYSDGGIMRVIQYSLKDEMLSGKHIVKLPLKSGGDLLVSDVFRSVVETSELKGLLFKPIEVV